MDPKSRAEVSARLLLHLAGRLAAEESDLDRQRRMRNAVRTNLDTLRLSSVEDLANEATAMLQSAGVGTGERAAIVVTLAFGDPFSPCWFDYDVDAFDQVLGSVAVKIGVPKQYWEDVRSSVLRLRRPEKPADWKRAGLVAAAVVLAASTGGLLAPAIGGLFSAPGLVGAAASSSGLAALGGGTVAAGGLGLAGGMGLIAGGFGLAGVGPGLVLTTLLDSALAADRRLDEIWVTYEALVSKDRYESLTVASLLAELSAIDHALAEAEERERARNDDGAPVLVDLERRRQRVQSITERIRRAEQPPPKIPLTIR